jgi:hypothetical protein
MHTFKSRNLKGRIILIQILKKQGVIVWTIFKQLDWTRSSGDLR